ncbi:MAG: S-adenosylmethionine/tRNA-ribosyltransferase-isomerase [Deltaproteobacteria bacterium]|nr:S-adenosylmethionine/tRNA-ribosyltransferase-isomerase [Deltaproteobacteria bacterium]
MQSVTVADQSPPPALALSDFQFDLPPALIAQVPAERRDHARLMVLDRGHAALTHTDVRALPAYLRPGDLVVVNDTKVLPARLFGRTSTGGAVELLLVRPTADSVWLCLGKPGRRLRPGTTLTFPEGVCAEVTARHGDGRYSVAFPATVALTALMERHGEVPLPPYIHRPDGPLPLDHTRYQTIFAARAGAVAAPTAGLHFTAELLAAIESRGVRIARLTLHVGPGTFLPVRSDDLCQHRMEAEWCEIPEDTARRIAQVKREGGRVVAVGTTTTRALESAATPAGVQAGVRWADRFITPGHRFQVIDALLTNFHLPGSTLLLLVSAFAGRERILAAYAEAVARRYRFYSYGDAMLIC